MDELPPPPPYTPHDPNGPSSETSEQPPIRASMRGGYLNILDGQEATPLSSAAAYFEQRPLTIPIPLPLMSITLGITPLTNRDDLSYTRRAPEMRSHDVSTQDWATFINHIVAELRNDVQNDPEKNHVPVSPEEFRDCLSGIEAVVTEWNRFFFEPRSVLLDAHYTYDLAARSPSPSPSYRTFQTLPPPFPAPSDMPSFPSGMFTHTGPHLGPHAGPHAGPPHFTVPPHLARLHDPSPVQIVPPQFSHPSLPVSGVRTIGLHHSHGHHRREHRDRGSHVRGRGHHRRSSSISSLRSSSISSSSSSSSSGSDVESISSEDIEGADEKDIKQSLENFRLNPTRLNNVKSAILQLHSELHSHRSAKHRGLSRACRSPTERTWEKKASLKANKKMIKFEIKALVRESRTHKRALKCQRKADKRIARAERRYRKVERQVQGSELGSFPETVTGHPDVGRDLGPHGIGLRGVRSYLVNSVPTTTIRRTTSGINRIPSWSAGHLGEPQESRVINEISTFPGDYKIPSPQDMSVRSDAGSATARLSAEEQARIAEEEALEVEGRLREMEIHAGKLNRLQGATTRQVEREAERREIKAEREAKMREKKAAQLTRQREREAQKWEKAASRISRKIEESSEQESNEASERAKELRKEEDQRKRRQQQESKESERRAKRSDEHAEVRGRRCEESNRLAEDSGKQTRVELGRSKGQKTGGGAHVESEASSGTARGGTGSGSRSQSYQAYFENMGRGMEQWGERFGRDMEQWGERFGKDMEAKFSENYGGRL